MLGLARSGPNVMAMFAVCALAAWTAGCGGTSSANQALDEQLNALGAKREAVAHFAGTVTVDGLPPAPGPKEALVVVLYDPKNPPGPGRAPRFAFCRKEGRFEFNTYERGDGVPAGSYIVLFEQPKIGGRGNPGFKPPDALKNLYNDPDKNALVPEFKIDLTSPGRTDYAFNLAVAGKDPIAQPGPNAVTEIRLR
ncbi:MAG TPA: hypothetical protein VEI07_27220 [Planctomycetaceae bacterium]|nr:hypothetical protein [Planctomycetaceae bacterium]